MHVYIFESLQLEGLYVGDLLYLMLILLTVRPFHDFHLNLNIVFRVTFIAGHCFFTVFPCLEVTDLFQMQFG